MARRRSADVTPVLRLSGLVPPAPATRAKADAERPGHKKRPRVRGLGLRRRPRQRRVHSSGQAAALSRKSNNMRAILSVSDKSGLVEFARGLPRSRTGGYALRTGGCGLRRWRVVVFDRPHVSHRQRSCGFIVTCEREFSRGTRYHVPAIRASIPHVDSRVRGCARFGVLFSARRK